MIPTPIRLKVNIGPPATPSAEAGSRSKSMAITGTATPARAAIYQAESDEVTGVADVKNFIV
jgi:hypothetical protein